MPKTPRLGPFTSVYAHHGFQVDQLNTGFKKTKSIPAHERSDVAAVAEEKGKMELPRDIFYGRGRQSAQTRDHVIGELSGKTPFAPFYQKDVKFFIGRGVEFRDVEEMMTDAVKRVVETKGVETGIEKHVVNGKAYYLDIDGKRIRFYTEREYAKVCLNTILGHPKNPPQTEAQPNTQRPWC